MSKPEDFSVGWICAITTEYVAAQAFLDEKYNVQITGNQNHYALGRIDKHNVAISVLPMGTYGVASAAHVASQMMNDFPNIRIALMVGIGGGAPSAKHDIRLGDIVVSSPSNGQGGVFHYDFGKVIQGQYFRNTGFLNQPPGFLRAAVAGLEGDYELEGHQLDQTIQQALDKRPRLRQKYQRPSPDTDRLYRSDIIHTNDSAPCDPGCGVKSSRLIARRPREEYEDNPAIHYGLIASADKLMKNAEIRDKFAAERGILCFEMEAAGLMNNFPCLVIRGICDYSDSHKNDAWQGYAAMAAAAYAKDLLYQIAPQQVRQQETVATTLKQGDTHTHYHMDFGPNNQGFQVGLNHGAINGTSFNRPIEAAPPKNSDGSADNVWNFTTNR